MNSTPPPSHETRVCTWLRVCVAMYRNAGPFCLSVSLTIVRSVSNLVADSDDLQMSVGRSVWLCSSTCLRGSTYSF